MREAGFTGMPPSLEEEALLSSLQSLRNDGAQRLDPARFHYLELLAQRMTAAADTVRPILAGKLQQALADYGERFTQAQQAAGEEVARLAARHPEQARELRRLHKSGDHQGVRRLGTQAALSRPMAPLVALNRYIQNTPRDGADGQAASPAARPEMKSVGRFREVWSRMAAVDQVDQAVRQGPANAGPLNSHMLVLHSLALMRSLSPDYLRRFLSHVDTLLWLDQANQKPVPAEAKPARRSRAPSQKGSRGK